MLLEDIKPIGDLELSNKTLNEIKDMLEPSTAQYRNFTLYGVPFDESIDNAFDTIKPHFDKFIKENTGQNRRKDKPYIENTHDYMFEMYYVPKTELWVIEFEWLARDNNHKPFKHYEYFAVDKNKAPIVNFKPAHDLKKIGYKIIFSKI